MLQRTPLQRNNSSMRNNNNTMKCQVVTIIALSQQLVGAYIANKKSHVKFDEEEVKLCTVEELVKVVKKSKLNKDPGEDDISNLVCKNFTANACEWLLRIINKSLLYRHFPNPWKLDKVLPFPKPGKSLRNPANFRLISLLVNLSKYYGAVILSRHEANIEANRCLPDEQYGFRSQHSTTKQLLNVADRITHGFNT